MTNKEIYSRTLGFSVRRLLFDILAFIIMILLAAAGFLVWKLIAKSKKAQTAQAQAK